MSVLVEKQEPEHNQRQSEDNQGRSSFLGKFKPLLEYRQLPILCKKSKNEPITLGQLYRNEISINSSNSETSSNVSDNEVMTDLCDCKSKSVISLRSLYSNYDVSIDDQSTFETKLNAHAQSYQTNKKIMPENFSIMFDSRVGEFV